MAISIPEIPQETQGLFSAVVPNFAGRAKINYSFLNLDMSKESNMRTSYRRKDLGEGVRGKHFADLMKGSNPLILTTVPSSGFPADESGHGYPGEPVRAALGKKKSVGQE